jgi:hypothetical protein
LHRCSSACNFATVFSAPTAALSLCSHALENAVEEHESSCPDLLHLHLQALGFYSNSPEVSNFVGNNMYPHKLSRSFCMPHLDFKKSLGFFTTV